MNPSPAADDPAEIATGPAPPAAAAAPRGVRRNALAEIVGFIALFVAVDIVWLDATGYWHWSPHPFWAIVVFVASQYGSREGLAAAALSSVALFAGEIPDQRLSQDLYAWLFELARLPLLWSVSAVLLGELRMRHVRERDELRLQVEQARERAATIAAAYESLNETKSQLEVRVAGQLRTVVSMYKAARAVETMEPAHVLTGALENVRAVISPTKCSIYLLSAGELEAAIQHGWHRRDRYKRVYRDDSSLFREVIGRARVVCIAEPEDETLLAGEGVIAGPLINPDTGEVRGMIKIEDMGFLELNLSTIEIFRVLCEWVGAFYANAQRYRQGELDRGIDSRTQLYAAGFLERMETLLAAIARRARFRVAALAVIVEAPERTEAGQQIAIAGALGAAVHDALRDTDLAFERQDAPHAFDILLPLAGEAEARLVGERLRASLLGRLPRALAGLPIRLEARDVHAPAPQDAAAPR